MDFLVKERLKDEEGAVLRLTEDNFDNIVRATPLMLVEFFADWCPPCQALAPHFYGAAKRCGCGCGHSGRHDVVFS